MIESNIEIINKLGLHARAAAKLVSTTSAFSASIQIGKDGKWVDGKSIMAVMMLAANKGTTLKLKTEGPDEQDAMNAITQLIDDYFGEGE